MAQSLAKLHLALHSVVQISNSASMLRATSVTHRDRFGTVDQEPTSPRITPTNRIVGTRQTITDAAVYIFHLP